jgi:hypothetical protein
MSTKTEKGVALPSVKALVDKAAASGRPMKVKVKSSVSVKPGKPVGKGR